MLYRKTEGGRRDKALNDCFLTPNVANRMEHITNLGRCEVEWLRIPAPSACPFLSPKSNQVILGKKYAWFGEGGSERKKKKLPRH